MGIHKLHSMILKPGAKSLKLNIISEAKGEDSLIGFLGETVVPTGDFKSTTHEGALSLMWKGGVLRVNHALLEDGECSRYDITWTSVKPSKLVDSFDLRNGHWYGGAELKKQAWPLEKAKVKMQPYVTGVSTKDEYGSVQERYWLCSKGIAISVPEDIPLYVGMNGVGDARLSMMAYWHSPYNNYTKTALCLKYSIYHGPDIKRVHQLASSKLIQRPIGIPSEDLFARPIWSTWAYYKNEINHAKILKYAQQVASHKFPRSLFIIEDNWTPSYGDMDFDYRKFPRALDMVKRLKMLGFKVSLWVHPFVTVRTPPTKEGDFWVKGSTSWWNGVAKYLDVTNEHAVKWFLRGLRRMKREYEIDTFKFDAGEVHYLPKKWGMKGEGCNPNIYTTRYAAVASLADDQNRRQEVRVGAKTQHQPMFVRIMDRESSWQEEGGIKSVIPTVLTFGIIGYPFVLPDMIGGNAYEKYPDRELFIRWMQVCTLMPCMQFSITPWEYGADVVRMALQMLAIRKRFLDYMLAVAYNCVDTGEPIIRPLWWIAPGDEFAQVADTQFLLGNDVMVAPVVEAGARSRMIYMPKGVWRDEITGETLGGGRFYFNYKAELDQLPHFTKMEPVERRPEEPETRKSARQSYRCSINIPPLPNLDDLAPQVDPAKGRFPGMPEEDDDPDLISFQDEETEEKKSTEVREAEQESEETEPDKESDIEGREESENETETVEEADEAEVAEEEEVVRADEGSDLLAEPVTPTDTETAPPESPLVPDISSPVEAAPPTPEEESKPIPPPLDEDVTPDSPPLYLTPLPPRQGVPPIAQSESPASPDPGPASPSLPVNEDATDAAPSTPQEDLSKPTSPGSLLDSDVPLDSPPLYPAPEAPVLLPSTPQEDLSKPTSPGSLLDSDVPLDSPPLYPAPEAPMLLPIPVPPPSPTVTPPTPPANVEEPKFPISDAERAEGKEDDEPVHEPEDAELPQPSPPPPPPPPSTETGVQTEDDLEPTDSVPFRRLKRQDSGADHSLQIDDSKSNLLDEFKKKLQVQPSFDDAADESEEHRSQRVKSFFELEGSGKVKKIVAEIEEIEGATSETIHEEEEGYDVTHIYQSESSSESEEESEEDSDLDDEATERNKADDGAAAEVSNAKVTQETAVEATEAAVDLATCTTPASAETTETLSKSQSTNETEEDNAKSQKFPPTVTFMHNI